MVSNLLNHIQGKNGSDWAKFVRKTGPDNIIILAVDAAKFTHKAMITDFYGEILVKPFDFDASLSGFEKIKNAVKQTLNNYAQGELVVGIETTGHYYEDLVHHCRQENYRVRIINAATTAQERSTLLNWSKTDNLDLMAIVQSVIHGRGAFNELPSGSVYELQKLTRARRELVQSRSAIRNHIRVYMDHIFREFQGKSILEDGKFKKKMPFTELFGKASRYIMRHYPHPSDILMLGEVGLREISIKENLKIRDSSIEMLLEFAEDSISQPKEEVEIDIYLLCQRLDQLDFMDRQIKLLEKKIENLFIETEGAVIVTVPGIGVVTGAELYAEMGDVTAFDHAGQLIKMAGTNPIVKQSGGRKPSYYGISKQGRRTFRNITYQVGKSLAHNNPDMNLRYKKLLERGKYCGQAYIALGNRMIRLAFSMIRNKKLYHTTNEDYQLVDELSKKIRSANVKRFYERFVIFNTPQSA